MKKKLFTFIFALFLALFSFIQSASALIYSDGDIYQKINQLNILINTDFIGFINKSDLVGYRLASFEMSVSNYKNNARMSIDTLNNTLGQIRKIRSSSELSDTDKSMQTSRLYQDAAKLMYDMDNQTMNFLMNLNQVMPTITYSRFVKAYQDFYNELNLTNADVQVK